MILLLIISLLPDKPLPAYIPGDDVVVYQRYGEGDYLTLEGKHATVTDLKFNKWLRRIEYEVNLQGWGDFERHAAERLTTRRKFDVMQAEFLKELNYPSWWNPLYRDE